MVSSVDNVSKKQIDGYTADKLCQMNVEFCRKKILIAREKAEAEKQLAEIRHIVKMKDIEFAKQKILLVKEMVEEGIIDDMTAGQMAQQLLLGESQVQVPSILSSSTVGIDEKNIININEDEKDDI